MLSGLWTKFPIRPMMTSDLSPNRSGWSRNTLAHSPHHPATPDIIYLWEHFFKGGTICFTTVARFRTCFKLSDTWAMVLKIHTRPNWKVLNPKIALIWRGFVAFWSKSQIQNFQIENFVQLSTCLSWSSILMPSVSKLERSCFYHLLKWCKNSWFFWFF